MIIFKMWFDISYNYIYIYIYIYNNIYNNNNINVTKIIYFNYIISEALIILNDIFYINYKCYTNYILYK